MQRMMNNGHEIQRRFLGQLPIALDAIVIIGVIIIAMSHGKTL